MQRSSPPFILTIRHSHAIPIKHCRLSYLVSCALAQHHCMEESGFHLWIPSWVDFRQERCLKEGWCLPPEPGASAKSPASRSRTCRLQLSERKRKIVLHTSSGEEGCHCSLTRPSALPPSAVLTIIRVRVSVCPRVCVCARVRFVITSLSAAVLYLAWIIHATRLVAKKEHEREREERGVFWRQQAP